MNNTKFVPLINSDEKEIIIQLINEYSIDIKNLYINIGDGKYISGILGSADKSIKNHFKYNHFIESINDLSEKTKLSIIRCISEYEKVNYYGYNPMTNSISKEENNAYYYMENALFRELILWDSLAQLYNIYFDLNKDVSKVSYKKIIKELLNSNYKCVDFKQIYNYIYEKIDISNKDIDVGIHDYICNLRHQMTHRYSIAITSLSENTNLRAMPDSIYKIAKDYNIVHKYINEILNLIIKKIV